MHTYLAERQQQAYLIRQEAEQRFNQDVDLSGVDDPTVLAWAAEEGRIVLTHDVATMITFAYQGIQAGLSMPRLFEVNCRVPVGLAIAAALHH
ncbi:MAG: hypothetical protein EDM05_030310 [Leptolyngbya sp. IPPAS B-1204]|nr:DUF5615 family PIN-like protein [Elainella sp. C42_A2020_010]